MTTVCPTGTAPYVCKGGGGLSNFDGFFPSGSNYSQHYPYGPPGTQSIDNAYANGARPASDGSNSTPISMFSGDQLPVKRAIVRYASATLRLLILLIPAKWYLNEWQNGAEILALSIECSLLPPQIRSPTTCSRSQRPAADWMSMERYIPTVVASSRCFRNVPCMIALSKATRLLAFLHIGSPTKVEELDCRMHTWTGSFAMSIVFSTSTLFIAMHVLEIFHIFRFSYHQRMSRTPLILRPG